METHTRVLFLAFLALPLSSCDKADRLRAEQQKVEAAKNLVQIELQKYEDQMRSLGPQGMASVAGVERQANEMIAKADLEQAKSSEKLAMWKDMEKSASELRAKADAWKAKYIR